MRQRAWRARRQQERISETAHKLGAPLIRDLNMRRWAGLPLGGSAQRLPLLKGCVEPGDELGDRNPKRPAEPA